MSTSSIKILICLIILLAIIGAVVHISVHSSALSVNPSATSTASSSAPSVTPDATSSGPVELDSVSPRAGVTGSSVALTGSGFTSDNTVLIDGLVAATGVPAAASSTPGIESLVFVVPTTLRPDCKPGEACPASVRLVTRGAYAITVENANGTSSYITYAVTNNPVWLPSSSH